MYYVLFSIHLQKKCRIICLLRVSKYLNIQKQDVMCLACANFLVTAISTIT